MVQRLATVALLLVTVSACRFDSTGAQAGGAAVDARVGVDTGPATSDALTTTDGSVTGDGSNCNPVICDHSRRRPIVIDASRLQAAVTDIPVLIRLDAANFDYGQTRANGEDVRFFSADLSVSLEYEIETWNSNGSSVVWVRIPSIDPNGPDPLQLWMYYGNARAPAGQNPTAVWNSGFVSVHHLSDDFDDSSAPAHDGFTFNSPMSTGGRIGGAYLFDGNDDYIQLPDENAYDFGVQMSASVWLRVTAFNTRWQAVLTKGDDSWRLHRDNNRNELAFSLSNQAGDDVNYRGPNVNNGMWHHILISYDGAFATVYHNGQEDLHQPYSQQLGNLDHPVQIGENAQATGRFFDGAIDEVRISSSPRSADWALVEYLSVTDSTFIVIGTEQAL